MAVSFDLLSILLIVVLFQGLFILSVIVIRHSLASRQHLYLSLMVLALIWFQAEFLSVRFPYDVKINLFYGTRYGAWLVLGPLFYFYVAAILGRTTRSPLMIAVHFIPFVIFWLIIPLFTVDLLSYQQIQYGMLSTFYPFVQNVPFLQYLYSALFGVQFIHVFTYLILSFQLIRSYEKTLKGNYSNIDTTVILWLKTLNILILAVIGFVTLFLILFFFTRIYDRNLDYLYVFPMALLVYIISYKLAGVEWRVAELLPEKGAKYEKSSLKTELASQYKLKLIEYVTTNKPYLNNELRLQELAEQLSVPPHHLSQVINEQLSSNFFDFINRYRVEEAKRLIKSKPEATLLEIAFEAGFNNKTSFTNAFKKFTTQTPLVYKTQSPVSEK